MTEKAEIVAATRETSVLEVISRAARDPDVDVDKLERLLAIQERLLADQRRTAFSAALARLQARMPQIAKAGVIDRGQGRSKSSYAKLEDIDETIRPLCADEGFAFAYDSKAVPSGIEFACAMSHREGHTETKTLTLPIDKGAGRSDVQSVGSTTSYARRYLIGMHLNLITRDEDDDAEPGVGGLEALSEGLASIAAAPSLSALGGVVETLKQQLADGGLTNAQANVLGKAAKARREQLQAPDSPQG